jgi:hypothetical protein
VSRLSWVTAARACVMSVPGRCWRAQSRSASTAEPASTVTPFHSPLAKLLSAALMSRRCSRATRGR